jgi:hypothetical protein
LAIVTIVVMLVGVAVILFGAPLLRTVDSTNPTDLRCTVTGAAAGTASAGQRGGATWSRVLIETSDCGQLTLTQGIDEHNRDSVAADLNDGGVYTFSIGGGTKFLLPGLRLFGLTPEVTGFERSVS